MDGFLHDSFGGWQRDLGQYKTLADTGNYPGGKAIANALEVIARLLAEKESFGLIGKFLELKDDLLDLSDDVPELKNFYKTQRPTWEKLRQAHTRFQLNRTWLEKDKTAAEALGRMKDILDTAAPYGMIKDVESLIQTVDGVNNALVAERRQHVLERIDAHIAKVEGELDATDASTDLRNKCLYPLQTLKSQVETQTSIAHINQAEQSAQGAADEVFDMLEAASKPKEKSGIDEEKPPVYVKKRRIVKAAQLAPKSFLETQADVDSYLDSLRQELESAINNNERIEIR